MGENKKSGENRSGREEIQRKNEENTVNGASQGHTEIMWGAIEV